MSLAVDCYQAKIAVMQTVVVSQIEIQIFWQQLKFQVCETGFLIQARLKQKSANKFNYL